MANDLRPLIQSPCGNEERRAEVAVAEEEHERGEEHREGEQNEDGGDEPRPYGERHASERHPTGALGENGDEDVDRAEPGAETEEPDADEPAVHAAALTGPGGGDGAVGRIAGPTGDRGRRREAGMRKAGLQGRARRSRSRVR